MLEGLGIRRHLVRIVLFPVFLFSSCGGVRSTIEARIAQKLPDLIGPAEAYQVRIVSPPLDLFQGKVSRLEITGVRVTPFAHPNPSRDAAEGEQSGQKEQAGRVPLQEKPATRKKSLGWPVVSRLWLGLHQVRYDQGKKRVVELERGEFSLHLEEGDLNRYLSSLPWISQSEGPKGERSALKEPLTIESISFQFRKEELSCISKVSLHLPVKMSMTIEITGNIEVQEKTEIHFRPTEVRIASLPIPRALFNLWLQEINPILDTRIFPFPVTVTSLSISPGSLTIQGDAALFFKEVAEEE